MSAVIAVFIGLVVVLSTRQVTLALVFAGVTFIVSLVVIAMLALAMKRADRPDRAGSPVRQRPLSQLYRP